jgi:hypothetical protein
MEKLSSMRYRVSISPRARLVVVQLVVVLSLCTLAAADGDHDEATASSPITNDAQSAPATTLPRPPLTSDGRAGVTVSEPSKEDARLMAEADGLLREEDSSTETQGEPQQQDTPPFTGKTYHQDDPATGVDEAAADRQSTVVPTEDVSAETVSTDSSKDGEHSEGFVIEQEDARHGLVEYDPAPEDQALDHLISMASKGLRVVASGAVVGFHRAREVVMRTARKLSSKQFVDTVHGWLAINETARNESMTAAHKALLSVHQTTAVVLARTPDYLDRSRQKLDEACHSVFDPLHAHASPVHPSKPTLPLFPLHTYTHPYPPKIA